jgi:hypothetical protein
VCVDDQSAGREKFHLEALKGAKRVGKPETQDEASQTAVPIDPVAQADSSLHSLVMEEEGDAAAPVAAAAPVLSPVGPAAPIIPSAPLLQPTKAAPVVKWPADVPSHAQAEQILSGGAEAPAALHETTRNILASCSEIETAALWGNELPFDPAGVRNAVVMKWRLAAALTLQPTGTAGIDGPALDALLVEVDDAMAKLPPADGLDEATVQALGELRGALARDAVALSEVAQKASQAAAAAAATTAKKKYEKVAAKVVSVSAAAPEKDTRTRNLGITFGVVMLITVGFHAYRFIPKPAPSSPVPVNVSGLPAGVQGVRDDKSGMTFVKVSAGGETPDPATVEQLKAQAAAEGKVVQDMGNGRFMIAPSGSKLPPAPPGPPR